MLSADCDVLFVARYWLYVYILQALFLGCKTTADEREGGDIERFKDMMEIIIENDMNMHKTDR